ncbi:MAG: SUMF1/EgtB/PvdO family nonheme iron enzyme [Anaerolineales bacterium]|nr:SUMF1/EgtB/PvdO family nonheme iron enzyme [Anaerolineales bacterium]
MSEVYPRYVQQLFEAYQDGKITPMERMAGGLSGAQVVLVDIQGSTSRQYDGLAFAKIDTKDAMEKALRNQQRATDECIKSYLAGIIGGLIGPVVQDEVEYALLLYQPAQHRTQSATSLAKLIEHQLISSCTKQITYSFDPVLKCWHDARDIRQGRASIPIYEALQAMINVGGKKRTRDINSRAREMGLPPNVQDNVSFWPGHDLSASFPNPIAYALNAALWHDKKLTIPRGPMHGDFHADNLMCKLDALNQPADTPPWLIDLQQFDENGFPLFDLAYLELDVMLRTLGAETEADWNDWVHLTQFLARGVVPPGLPQGIKPASVWQLIQPIRQYLAQFLQPFDESIAEQYENAFWLAVVAAGTIATRRSHNTTPQQRKVTLLYAASALRHLLQQIGLEPSQTLPYQVQWQAGSAPLRPDDIAAYREGLLREMHDELKTTIDLRGEQRPEPYHPTRALEPSPDELEDLFGSLFAATIPAMSEKAQEAGERVPKVRERLMKLKRVVLLGEPGSGKTTLLQRLTLDYADDKATKADGEAPPLPVFVKLSGFDGKTSFSEYAEGQLGALQPYRADLKLVWLFDALNEMPRTGPDKRKLMPEVLAFIQGCERFVVSCRVRDYTNELSSIPHLDRLQLRDLTPAQIYRIITQRLPEQGEQLWQLMHGSADLIAAWDYFVDHEDDFWQPSCPIPDTVKVLYFPEDERAAIAQRLQSNEAWRIDYPQAYGQHRNARQRVHQDKRRLLLACRNPFTLGQLVIGLFRWAIDKGLPPEQALPGNRAGLFNGFVTKLLNHEAELAEKRQQPWPPEHKARIETVLSAIAAAVQRTEQRTEITRAAALQAAQAVDSSLDAASAEALLRDAEAANLIQLGTTLQFSHQLFQEYFATAELLVALEGGQSPAPFFTPDWWEAGPWRETIVILGELVRDPIRVLTWLAPVTPELALSVLLRNGEGKTLADLTEAGRQALIEGARHHSAEPHPYGRAAAYRILGLVGADQRRGIGVGADGLPEIDWVEIPDDGKWTYQDRTHEPLSTFHMSRYPITYAQFQVFVEAADGFSDPRWWQGLADDEDRRRNQSQVGEQAFKVANHPRERVSWYDAMAFCRWWSWRLTVVHRGGSQTAPLPPNGDLPTLAGVDWMNPLTWLVRLPTEFEWEKAARGTDGRVYPWGNEYISGYANIDETARFGGTKVGPFTLGQTSAVGMYPHRAPDQSPYGVADLSGNVWEWCLTEYREPNKDIDITNSSPRVVRGGSWLSARDDARAAVRHYLVPSYRLTFRGFRVVASAPIPSGALVSGA